MGYRYIALATMDGGTLPPALTPAQSAFLDSHDLRAAFCAGPLAVYATPGTPTLRLGDSLLLGHVFPRDGLPTGPARLAAAAREGCPDTRLLGEWWGEYLLLRVAPGHGGTIGLLREPSGGVPCLYALGGSTGFVTSDASLAIGLGLHDGRIDWDFVEQALVHPHVTTTRTGLAGIRELLPGCSLSLDGRHAVVGDCWRPWDFVRAPHRHSDPQDAAAEIRATVECVVRTWARTDRSVLVELSGGLDSSIVAMSLADSGADVACCTLVTPVPGADERLYAAQVTRALGVDLHVGWLGFDKAHHDFKPPVPLARPRMSVLQYVAHEAVHALAERVQPGSFFSGAGGDTVFGYFQGAVPAADAWLERGPLAAALAVRNLSTLHQCTVWKAGRLTLRKLVRGAKAPCKPDAMLLPASAAIPEVDHPWFVSPPDTLPGDRERIADLAGTQVFRESAPRSASHWLRLPLLSQPVMEACLKAPSWMCIEGGRNRAVARRAFADVLPRDVLERRSKGTFMNYFGAIYQRNGIRMRDFLLEGRLRARRLIDADAVERFVSTPRPPRDTSFMRMFDLCMVENWLRHQR